MSGVLKITFSVSKLEKSVCPKLKNFCCRICPVHSSQVDRFLTETKSEAGPIKMTNKGETKEGSAPTG